MRLRSSRFSWECSGIVTCQEGGYCRLVEQMNLRVIMAFVLFLSVAWGQDKEKDGIEIKRGGFSHELGMLDAERDEYASYLAAQAANQLADEGKKDSQVKASRLLAVAKTLSPRNKRTLTVEAQIRQDGKPKPIEHVFTPPALAQLLMTRGKLLVEEKGAENHWLGRVFVELAAGLDPKNKQAVKEKENMEFDYGVLDWGALGQGN
jgi:hypothetical protein